MTQQQPLDQDMIKKLRAVYNHHAISAWRNEERLRNCGLLAAGEHHHDYDLGRGYRVRFYASQDPCATFYNNRIIDTGRFLDKYYVA